LDANTIIGSADHYAQFIQMARARIEALGITFSTVDAVAGFPERYTATLMSGGKACSVYSFFTLAAVLALTPMFAHNAGELERLKQHSEWIKLKRAGKFYRDNQKRDGSAWLTQHKLTRDFWALCGRKGGLQYAQNRTPKQRTEQECKAAKARWRRVS
jgi:hypothetical protein